MVKAGVPIYSDQACLVQFGLRSSWTCHRDSFPGLEHGIGHGTLDPPIHRFPRMVVFSQQNCHGFYRSLGVVLPESCSWRTS